MFDKLREANDLLWAQAAVFFSIVLVCSIPDYALGELITNLEDLTGTFAVPMTFNIFLSVILDSIAGAAIVIALAAHARGERIALRDSFSEAVPSLPRMFCGYFLMSVLVLGGCMMLILPGLLFAAKTAFVPFAIVLEGRSVKDAFNRSWTLTKGVEAPVLLVFLPFMILPAVVFTAPILVAPGLLDNTLYNIVTGVTFDLLLLWPFLELYLYYLQRQDEEDERAVQLESEREP